MKLEHLSTGQYKEIILLFQSRNIPYFIEENPSGKKIIVPDSDSEQALQELEAYFQENYQKKLAVIHRRVVLQYPFSSLNIWLLLLLAGFHNYLMNRGDVQSWYAFGRLSAESVLNGDWYRTITALALHKNLAHLFSNLGGLLLFTGALQRLKGIGIAWLLTIGAGALGNWFNAYFYQESHYSIGASTAVFGALGALVILGGSNRFTAGKQMFAALAGGVGLVAMLGVSAQTDVMAHIFGFLAGILLAVPFRVFEKQWKEKHDFIQYGLLVFSILVFVFFWYRYYQFGQA